MSLGAAVRPLRCVEIDCTLPDGGRCAYAAKFENPLLRLLVTLNPMTYLVEFPRNLVCLGVAQPLGGFVLATAFSFGVLVLGIHGFYLIKDKVVERL